ncbi:MAG: RNA polymerase sigma factor, partial [Solirubrobacterales bacterium]|nr:RNA polymerase sigma factor [Solirubrobacterales bacterium]
LVQETFERVLRRPRFLRSEDDLGYLLRVLRNTFFTQRRAAGRRPETAPLPEDVDLIEDRSAPAPDVRLESAELYAAIARLPDDFRDALVAVDVVGLSYREAARALRAREATITTRLHRARQRVARDLLSDSPPGDSTPPASAARRR